MTAALVRASWATVLVATLTAGCAAPGPGVIRYDSDACDHCRMTIADPSFAAQLVSVTGKVYRFDDPLCLSRFVATGQVRDAAVHSIWLNDHASPGRLIEAGDAVFVASDRIRAPMNGGLAAFAAPADARAYSSSIGGRIERWADVLKRGRS